MLTSVTLVFPIFGTVPIRRTSEEELIAARMQAKVRDLNADPNTEEAHGLHLAVVRTKFDSEKKYNGGGMVSSVEMPWSKGSQYSGGQIKIQNGPDFIQAGWMLSCFNAQCQGFVLARSDHPVGRGSAEHLSHPRTGVHDPASGSWWLELGENYTVVGFWPQEIFSCGGGGLRDLATYVEWGGQVYSPPDVPSPPMGRAAMPLPNILYDASCQDMTTINENHDTEAAEETETYAGQDKYYQVGDMGHKKAPLPPRHDVRRARRGHRLGLTRLPLLEIVPWLLAVDSLKLHISSPSCNLMLNTK
ncbi:uncharacterized protein LOC130139858 [Syzygium oleosum]|uniref:uncharacterized protein LOC130139858 n=1 Tax=Syzygium oleosum TaxID=219896 RepID=UPI0024BA6A70|nr:uncharacterized protein LOC130139858 [Syzygium oleosum]